jgi:hypothetical protein
VAQFELKSQILEVRDFAQISRVDVDIFLGESLADEKGE